MNERKNDSPMQAIEVHPAANAEAIEAYDWYAARSQPAALGFQLELARAKSEIQSHPLRWEAYLLGTRRFLLAGYPYLIVYRIGKGRIEVLAIAHGSRKPGYWRSRLRTKSR